MKVAAIIPTYNRLESLKRAVQSVREQTHRVDEILVVDDGSTDGTAEWLVTQPDLTALYQENSGVSKARNLAIAHSQSDWLAFLDSDDEWLPHKIAEQVKVAQENPETRIIHGEEIWIRNGRRVNARKKHQKSGGCIYQKCLSLCLISPSAVMIHRSVFDHVGNFNESFPVCEDYDLWLKITANYNVDFIETPIIKKYGGHDDQLSRKFFAMDYWRVKSLYSILNNPVINKRLSDDEIQATKEMIATKSEILLNGYIKHENLANYDEVKDLSQKAQDFSIANRALNL